MSEEATPAKAAKPAKLYTEESINAATKEILEGQPQRATARKYGVPLTTIRDRVKAIKSNTNISNAAANPEDPEGAKLRLPVNWKPRRRGRPPGRPNMTVREADYASNVAVQAWNAAKLERDIIVTGINIRVALTPDALVHDTQRTIFNMPSREMIYFVQGWITARHIASQRPSYINGLLIQSRGDDAPVACATCQERRTKNALGPFLTCRVLPGSFHNSCANCKWFDNTANCSLYTGPAPNRRKRKTKEDGGLDDLGPPSLDDHHVPDAPMDDSQLDDSMDQSHLDHSHMGPPHLDDAEMDDTAVDPALTQPDDSDVPLLHPSYASVAAHLLPAINEPEPSQGT